MSPTFLSRRIEQTHGLPITTNCSRQRHGFCPLVIDETKNETSYITQKNQSETEEEAGHP